MRRGSKVRILRHGVETSRTGVVRAVQSDGSVSVAMDDEFEISNHGKSIVRKVELFDQRRLLCIDVMKVETR